MSSQSIPVDDDSSADLLAHLPAAVDYIRDALSDDVEGGVLVHCQAGMCEYRPVALAPGPLSRQIRSKTGLSVQADHPSDPCSLARSATIVAAYLMSEHELSVEDALTTIRRARRCIQSVLSSPPCRQRLRVHLLTQNVVCCHRPSDTFLSQLEIFGAAKYRVSNKDRVTREFYRDRVVTEVLSESNTCTTPGWDEPRRY